MVSIINLTCCSKWNHPNGPTLNSLWFGFRMRRCSRSLWIVKTVFRLHWCHPRISSKCGHSIIRSLQDVTNTQLLNCITYRLRFRDVHQGAHTQKTFWWLYYTLITLFHFVLEDVNPDRGRHSNFKSHLTVREGFEEYGLTPITDLLQVYRLFPEFRPVYLQVSSPVSISVFTSKVRRCYTMNPRTMSWFRSIRWCTTIKLTQ